MLVWVMLVKHEPILMFYIKLLRLCAGTIFAYGQTGCGKSHTMMGSNVGVDANG